MRRDSIDKMKTLDEVIREVAKRRDLDNDIYHYLKEYRDECNNIVNVHDDYIRLRNEVAEELNKANPALSWDELKQMEGKPVWVEADNGQEKFKHWFIIDEFTYSDIPGLQIMWCLYNFRFWEADLGKTWQAYRKERKATGGNLIPEPKSKKIGDDTEILWRENEKLVD